MIRPQSPLPDLLEDGTAGQVGRAPLAAGVLRPATATHRYDFLAARAQGYDFSAWQTTDLVAATIARTRPLFVFLRLTYGMHRDARLLDHAAAVAAAGIPLFGYAFGISGSREYVVAQADAAVSAAEQVRAHIWALDLETEVGLPPMTDVEATAFLARSALHGATPGLYHSTSGYPDLGQAWRWPACWGCSDPGLGWTFWQYAGDPGLDRDVFRGPAAELDKFLRLSNAPPATQAAHFRLSITAPTNAYARRATTGYIGDRIVIAPVSGIGANVLYVPLDPVHRTGGTFYRMVDGPLPGWLVSSSDPRVKAAAVA